MLHQSTTNGGSNLSSNSPSSTQWINEDEPMLQFRGEDRMVSHFSRGRNANIPRRFAFVA